MSGKKPLFSFVCVCVCVILIVKILKVNHACTIIFFRLMFSLSRTHEGNQQLLVAKWQKCVLNMYMHRFSPCVYIVKFIMEVKIERNY